MVLEESSTCISYLHKQIPFVPFWFRSPLRTSVAITSDFRRYRPILRPIFIVVRFRYPHSFIPISFGSSVIYGDIVLITTQSEYRKRKASLPVS